MKPIRSLAVFAIAGLVGGLGVAAVTALPAAAKTPVHVSTSTTVRSTHQVNASAVSNCRFHSNRFVTYYGNCTSWINWSCAQGNQHSIRPPTFVSNDCAHDALLFTNSNETGRTLCIRPFSKTGRLSPIWHSFRIRVGFTC